MRGRGRETPPTRYLFQLTLCEGTIFNTIEKSFKKLETFEEGIKVKLLHSEINHADETPIKVNKKMSYLHVLSNDFYTLISANKSRGKVALEEIGILNKYKGILSHDSYSMYFSYNFRNALCHAHLGRILTLIEEEYKCRWAHELRIFFLDLNDYLDDYRGTEDILDKNHVYQFQEEFRRIITRGSAETPLWNAAFGSRTAAGNLLPRLIIHKKSVLRFMYNLEVPFTNNLAERDLRMTKVKQKISGCFRSFKGAEIYARIRSYISTIKKQGRDLWSALKYIHETSKPQYYDLFN